MPIRVLSDLSYTSPIHHGRFHFGQYDRHVGCDRGLDKKTLDLYIPVNNLHDTCGGETDSASSDEPPLVAKRLPPIVVFVHGGGWRRGHTKSWKHYISRFDTNLLVALYTWYRGHYSNVGESFVRSGYACAVVTYPLIAPPIGIVILESVTSFLMSWCLAVAPVFLIHLLVLLVGQIAAVLDLGTRWLNSSRFQPEVPQSTLRYDIILSLWSLQIINKIILITNSANYIGRRKQTSCTSSANHSLVDKLQAAILTFSSIVIIIIFYISPIVCTGPSRISLLVLIDSVCSQTLITGSQLWKRNARRGNDFAESVFNQVYSIARAVRYVQDLGDEDGALYDNQRIILCGHSAGASMVSLLGLDRRYLEAVGVERYRVKGIISMCGIYDVSSLASSAIPRALYLVPAFGSDPRGWRRLSPYHRIAEDAPWKTNFLVVTTDWEVIPDDDTDRFCTRLISRGYQCRRVRLGEHNHFGVINAFRRRGQPSTLEMICVDFIEDVGLTS